MAKAQAPTTLARASYATDRPVVPLNVHLLTDMGYQSEWSSQSARYQTLWEWYDGQVWDRNRTQYPLAYNPLRIACMYHRNALFGEVDDTADPLVRTSFIIEDFEDDKVGDADGEMSDGKRQRIERGHKLARFVNTVHSDNNSRAIMLQNGLITQALGGSVYVARFDPMNPNLSIPIRIEAVNPEEFMPVYSPSNLWDLLEAYIIRYIRKPVAKALYNVETAGTRGVYIEKWTKDSFEITIDDEIASQRTATGWKKLIGKHEYGMVPVIYIPHEREGLDFYGTPLLHQQEGMLEELNGRIADLGDAIRDGTHRDFVAVNVTKGVLPIQITPRVQAANLGVTMPGGGDPDVRAIEPPTLPQGTQQFVVGLEEQFRIGVFTPDVAYGQDEGSQRSALTLALRMWPLIAHIRTERTNHTIGFNLLAELMLRIAVAHSAVNEKLAEWGITKEDFNLRKRQDWAPMMPRDTESQQNITIARKQAGILSTQSAIERDDSTDDAAEELRRIRDEQAKAREEALKNAEAQSSIKAQSSPTTEGGDSQNARQKDLAAESKKPGPIKSS